MASETELQGKALNPQNIAAAAAKAAEGADPDDDIYASAEYKRHMATVLVRRAIEAAVQRPRTKDTRRKHVFVSRTRLDLRNKNCALTIVLAKDEKS